LNFDAYVSEPLAFAEAIDPVLSGGHQTVIFNVGACEGEDSIRSLASGHEVSGATCRNIMVASKR